MRSQVTLCDHRLCNDALSTEYFKFFHTLNAGTEDRVKGAEGGRREQGLNAEKQNVGWTRI